MPRSQSGLVNVIAEALSVFGSFPLFWLMLVVMIVVVYLGELASNTAMAAIFLPISGAFAISIGADPLVLTLPVTVAASLGFMLPVATPPNAIVFGSGAVTVQQMLRAGAILDVICIVFVAVIVGTLGYSILGL
jgi:sodium-dependent dicarboxylate transporter 2/3/5